MGTLPTLVSPGHGQDLNSPKHLLQVMCSPCHQRTQPLAQVGNYVASSPECLSWVLCPQPDLRHCPSPRQMLPKDHRVLNSTSNRRGLPLRVTLPGLPQVSRKSGKGSDDRWGNDLRNYSGQRQDWHPISPPYSIHKKNHEQQCLCHWAREEGPSGGRGRQFRVPAVRPPAAWTAEHGSARQRSYRP